MPQVDYNKVSSDCFMLNFTYIMLVLFDPVIAKDKDKKDSVKAKYVTSPTARLQYHELTRIAMDSDAAKKVTQAADSSAEWGFNTESFFFTFHAVHLGLLPATNHWTRVNQEIGEIKGAIEEANANASRQGAGGRRVREGEKRFGPGGGEAGLFEPPQGREGARQ